MNDFPGTIIEEINRALSDWFLEKDRILSLSPQNFILLA